jgi:hypothetical protein
LGRHHRRRRNILAAGNTNALEHCGDGATRSSAIPQLEIDQRTLAAAPATTAKFSAK